MKSIAKQVGSKASEIHQKSVDYLGNIQIDLTRYVHKLEPLWIYGLVDIEEAASFEFVVLEDL
ncbi:hypothetical protein [Alistipes sp. ZOR0009]|jgi:hypothetical protein|uniref:hypothetical protein n=1 Tax=Alistipes sp. ZOR0009 TaxID=1339253 RepID=UPI00064717F3|nr:hypothetical protein [Alistipes sp. ZOR0009]